MSSFNMKAFDVFELGAEFEDPFHLGPHFGLAAVNGQIYAIEACVCLGVSCLVSHLTVSHQPQLEFLFLAQMAS